MGRRRVVPDMMEGDVWPSDLRAAGMVRKVGRLRSEGVSGEVLSEIVRARGVASGERLRAYHRRKREEKEAARVAAEALKEAGEVVDVASPEPVVSAPVERVEDDGRPRQLEMRVDGVTIEGFLADYQFVTILLGPWASGKTTACITKMFTIAQGQAASRGVRRTRWAVVRSTFGELRDTTIKSWLEWFPEGLYGPLVKQRPYTHVIRVPGEPDERGRPTTVEMEVIFMALDDENDRKKLLSLELTGAWINEARETIKGIIDDIIGRTGRYPPKRDGGHTWSGVIMDTNAPSETHWLPIMFGLSMAPEDMSEEERDALRMPDNWSLYVQPGALVPVRDDAGKIVDFRPNPRAENINNLTDGFEYYMKRKGGKPRSWVLVNFCNELGHLVSGKPVWPSFEKERHVSKVSYDPAYPLLVGVDSTGRQPAAVGAQMVAGRWRVLFEVIGRDMTSEQFAPQLRAKIAQIVGVAGRNYRDVQIMFWRDPHQQKSETDDRTTTQVYRKHGIALIPAPGGNAIATRTAAVEMLFDYDRIEIDPRCTLLVAGCSGGYRFRKLAIAGIDAYDEVPDKRNGYADVADALQYVVLGGGGGRMMIGANSARAKPVKAVSGYRPGKDRVDLWARRREQIGPR